MAIPYPIGAVKGASGDFYSPLINITVPANSTYTIGQGTFLMMPVTGLGVQMTGFGTTTQYIASAAGGMVYSDGGGACKVFNSSAGALKTQLIQIY